jgi:transglutaminase-like putative cysteine protease
MVGAVSLASGQEPKKDDSERPKAPKNLGFEEGEVRKAPAGWFMPPACAKGGYILEVSEENPFAGKRCAILRRAVATEPETFGNIIQSVDATQYRGKRVRFKAAVRAEVSGPENQAMMWLRVDRPGDQMGFFDNMADRPIKTNTWKHHEIVGDVADDAQVIVFGMMLIGNGSAAIDDVSFEIVDKATTKPTGATTTRSSPSPGLTEVAMATTVNAISDTNSVTFMYPLPLAYRDQVPLTFRLAVDPPSAAKSVEIVESAGPNRVLKLTLGGLQKNGKVNIEYRSLVLVAPTEFAGVPKSAPFPKEWPVEAKPWLAATWCCDHDDERVKKVAQEIRGESDDVLQVINSALKRAREIFSAAKGHVSNLTAVEALDKRGSCTSCANLVAALLRGAGVPARVLSGYPLWTGPLQTHYIVEAYVPGYGWYPVESTRCEAPWPNHQQVNVSIVPIEHESEKSAGRRSCAAGAVPYLSLTELADPTAKVFSMGTLKQYCDHECRLMHSYSASDDEWAAIMAWARPRWTAWLTSGVSIKDGRVAYGPAASDVRAKTLAELRAELP